MILKDENDYKYRWIIKMIKLLQRKIKEVFDVEKRLDYLDR